MICEREEKEHVLGVGTTVPGSESMLILYSSCDGYDLGFRV